MKHDNLKIEIDGGEVEGPHDDLVSLEVELDEDLAGMFHLTISLMARPDGTWPYLDDDKFPSGRRWT